jgi:peptidoglycan/LPS O-acetylase OafA/YrhL
LVAQSWVADPNVWRFAARRLLRIWPGFAAVTILAALVLGPSVSSLTIGQYFVHPLFANYAWNLLFQLQDILPLHFLGNALPTAINGSLWTIPLELTCYGALAIVGIVGLLRRGMLLPVLTISAALLTYVVGEPMFRQHPERITLGIEQIHLLHFGLYFFSGVSLNQFRIHDMAPTRARVVVETLWLLGAVALAFDRPQLTLWLVLPATVILIGNARTPVLHRVGRFGDLSYGLYIYAFPVQQTLIWRFGNEYSWTSVLAMTLGTTVLLAFASWHLIEKPALRFKPRRAAKSLSPPQTYLGAACHETQQPSSATAKP